MHEARGGCDRSAASACDGPAAASACAIGPRPIAYRCLPAACPIPLPLSIPLPTSYKGNTIGLRPPVHGSAPAGTLDCSAAAGPCHWPVRLAVGVYVFVSCVCMFTLVCTYIHVGEIHPALVSQCPCLPPSHPHPHPHPTQASQRRGATGWRPSGPPPTGWRPSRQPPIGWRPSSPPPCQQPLPIYRLHLMRTHDGARRRARSRRARSMRTRTLMRAYEQGPPRHVQAVMPRQHTPRQRAALPCQHQSAPARRYRHLAAETSEPAQTAAVEAAASSCGGGGSGCWGVGDALALAMLRLDGLATRLNDNLWRQWSSSSTCSRLS